MDMKKAIIVLSALLLAGCGAGRMAAPPALFDLGADVAATPALPARQPIVLAFEAVPYLSDTGVIWRVGDSASPHAYARSRWASAPAELVRQRLVERLSHQGPVLGAGMGAGLAQVQVTLTFEQVFAADGQASVGHVAMQAVLLQDRQVVGQVRIAREAPAATQDAAGGVQALRQATDAAADELAGWLAGR
ncbi:ABC-type transport auxiliary lipoprotein family protein, partial [Bordetella pertussis]